MQRRSDRRPEHEKKVDEDLFKYVKCQTAVEQQEANIATYDLTGRKVTATYERMEGGRGGPVSFPEENLIIRKMEAEEIIKVSQQYIDSVDRCIARVFFEQEHMRTFIRLYWWTYPRHTPVKIRMQSVLAEMPYLEYVNKRYRRKRDLFYDYRAKIYEELAKAFGYL